MDFIYAGNKLSRVSFKFSTQQGSDFKNGFSWIEFQSQINYIAKVGEITELKKRIFFHGIGDRVKLLGNPI